jgi:hypothetical protein
MDIAAEIIEEDRSILAAEILDWIHHTGVGPVDDDPERELALKILFVTWGMLWTGTADQTRLVRRALDLPIQ